jgi:hypothetical protein
LGLAFTVLWKIRNFLPLSRRKKMEPFEYIVRILPFVAIPHHQVSGRSIYATISGTL